MHSFRSLLLACKDKCVLLNLLKISYPLSLLVTRLGSDDVNVYPVHCCTKIEVLPIESLGIY